MRNLLLSGGYRHAHDFAATSQAHAENWSQVGIDSVITDDIDSALTDLTTDAYDLVTVNALRWTMRADRYTADRPHFAFSLSTTARAALTDFVHSGGGLVALHTASICFDDWSGWGDLVGATWNWTVSSHPPVGEFHVEVATDTHPITADIGDFVVTDEVYRDLDHHGDRVVLAVAGDRADGAGGAPDNGGPDNDGGAEAEVQALMWVRSVGDGRVFHDALGHGPTSVRQPNHATLLQRGARWAAGAEMSP